ncbi:MAG: DUF1475 family protein [Planctomycetes bacterium]|nr:DUF1475 family protein [Planctomycetota bacterium]
MKAVQILCIVLFAVLTYGIVRASLVENVLVGGERMLRDPWSLATLVDAYCGFCVASVWIWAVERKKSVAAAWIVALMLLGNLASLTWLFLRARRASSLGELVGIAR